MGRLLEISEFDGGFDIAISMILLERLECLPNYLIGDARAER